jgi:hypothetical protein
LIKSYHFLGQFYVHALADTQNLIFLNTVYGGEFTDEAVSSPVYSSEPVFVNLLGSPGIDPQPGGIDSWTP